MQEKLDDLVEQQNRNSMKFNNPKCKIMPLKTNHQNFCCRKGVPELGEGELNQLIDHRMPISSPMLYGYEKLLKMMLQHIPGENMQQSYEGISIMVKSIKFRSYGFLLICVAKII